jgi:integrase
MLRRFENSSRWRRYDRKTQISYARALKPWRMPDMRGKAVPEIRRRHVAAIHEGLTERGHAAANLFLIATSVWFRWMISQDVEGVEFVPSTEIKPAKREDGRPQRWEAWTERDYRHAVGNLPECLRRVIVLARYTGQRRSDLIAMQWSAYDGETITIEPHKNRRNEKERRELVIPVHPMLKAELDEWQPLANSTYILTTAQGKPWVGEWLSKWLGPELVKIGLPKGLNVHGLRKLFCAWMSEGGKTSKEIMSITGHRTLKMVELYTESAEQKRLAKNAFRGMGGE